MNKRHYPLQAARRIAVGLLFVFMAMVAKAESTTPGSEWGGSPAENIENANGGDGKSADTPILIKDAAELAYFAQQVNNNESITYGNSNLINPTEIDDAGGFKDCYFALSNDINLNGLNWKPIGNDKYFRGHFDGNGKVVEGLKIDINDESDNSVNAGLFGRVSGGEIRNLGVRLAKVEIKVKGEVNLYFGGIVGDTFKTTIRNCYVDAEEGGKIIVEATEGVALGGIAGEVNGTITHCYSTVDIEAKIDVSPNSTSDISIGGIAGINNGIISHCYATGSIIAVAVGEGKVALYVGGICDKNFTPLENNLALNKTLSGKTNNGNCYVNRIAGKGGGSATNNYASPQTTVNGKTVNNGATNNINGADTWLDKFKEDLGSEWEKAWVWTDGQLPQLKMVKDNDGTSFGDLINGQTDHPVSNYLPHSPWEQDATNAIENANGNNGLSPQTPIEINTAGELAYFAKQVNARGDIKLNKANATNTRSNNGTTIQHGDKDGQGFSAYYFALSKDINLLAGEWTPIGNKSNNPFCGHFDGKGHVVNGLKIKMDVEGGTDGDWTLAGLFGYVVNGTLQNIGVELADEGIEVSAEKGDVFAGGIAGRIDGIKGTAILRHCYVTGGNKAKIKITEAGISAYVGGIAGWGSIVIGGNLTLTHCYATVDVESNATSNSYAGGIAGYSDNASYCFATGNVKAKTYSGGICGNGTVSNSLALNPEIEGDGRINRITAFSSTSNYASPQTKIEGNTTTSIDPDSPDGADTWLETFKNDLLNAPGGKGWSKGWVWDDLSQLPKLKVAVSNANGEIESYSEWLGNPAQPDIDAANFLKDCPYPRLHIQSPTGATLTVTDASDTPIADNAQVRPGTMLKLSHAITDGYSFNHYLRGTSANQIDQKIEGETYVMPNQDVWISASVNEPSTPDTEPDPVYPPPTPIYYTVTLPQVEGATTDPEAGIHEVESWNTFRFYLTLDPGYSDSQPIVTTSRGETLVPRQSDGAYLVKYVRSDVEISIDSIRPNLPPVANEAIDAPANRPRIWTEASTLCIGMPPMAPASTVVNVITADGRLLQSFNASPGLNRRQLPRGFYIIRISDLAWKVIIR